MRLHEGRHRCRHKGRCGRRCGTRCPRCRPHFGGCVWISIPIGRVSPRAENGNHCDLLGDLALDYRTELNCRRRPSAGPRKLLLRAPVPRSEKGATSVEAAPANMQNCVGPLRFLSQSRCGKDFCELKCLDEREGDGEEDVVFLHASSRVCCQCDRVTRSRFGKDEVLLLRM